MNSALNINQSSTTAELNETVKAIINIVNVSKDKDIVMLSLNCLLKICESKEITIANCVFHGDKN